MATPLTSMEPLLPARSTKSLYWRAVGFGLYAALFMLSLSPTPVGTSPRDTWFVHGFADAGFGQLAHDWFATTTDPFAVYSFFVQIVVQFFHPLLLTVAYYVLISLYVYSLIKISLHLRADLGRSGMILLYVLLPALHAVFRGGMALFAPELDSSWRTLGFAGQELLAGHLQPATFGVLLLLSIALMLERRWFPAVLFAVATPYIHSSYMLPAAFLILAYMLLAVFEQRSASKAVTIGAVAFALELPLLFYLHQQFLAVGPEVAGTAAQLLAYQTLPRHTLPSQWFDLAEGIKFILLLLTLWLARGNRRLLVLFGVPAVLGFFLSLAVPLTGSARLALLFPWRVSTILIPIGIAVLLARIAVAVTGRFPRVSRHPFISGRLGWALVLVMALAGSLISGQRFESWQSRDESGVVHHVRTHLTPGQLYLIPPHLSSFRLETGAPIVVDGYLHPYRGDELMAWHQRLADVEGVYELVREPQSLQVELDLMTRHFGITHVLLPAAAAPLLSDQWRLEFSDRHYQLWRHLTPDPGSLHLEEEQHVR